MSTRHRLGPKRLLHFGRLFAIAGVGLTVLAHQWATPLMLLGAESLAQREMGILPDIAFAIAVLCVGAAMVWVLIERNPGLEAALKRPFRRDVTVAASASAQHERVDWRARLARARQVLSERRVPRGGQPRSMSDRAAAAMDVLLLGSSDPASDVAPAEADDLIIDDETDPFAPPPAADTGDDLFPQPEAGDER